MAGFPEQLVGRLGVYYRLRDEDDLILDDTTEADGFRRGYLFTIVRKGHVHCNCMKSIRLKYFKFHVNRVGQWPLPRLLVGAYGQELAALLGDDFELYVRQFCLIRVSPIRNVFDSPPWLVTGSNAEVVIVTESDSDSPSWDSVTGYRDSQ